MSLLLPRRLRPGDKVALVSLSSGMIGDAPFLHKLRLAETALRDNFGLTLVPMDNALRGSAYLSAHPEARAADLMQAFRDPEMAGVFSAIGGEDSIRLLPHVDLQVLHDNPKVFLGYSDTTVTHFLLHAAGVVSFYGPSVMCEFGEYGGMFDYCRRAVQDVLFTGFERYEVPHSPTWTDTFIPWAEENMDKTYEMAADTHGYEVLSGSGRASGPILGGCLELFTMLNGTKIWPKLDDWKGALLLLETSEDHPNPELLRYTLRNLAAQGILKELHGILFGKPKGEVYYEEYKEELLGVVVEEEGLCGLPILYNVNIGHARPIGVLPLGTEAEIDCGARTLTLTQCPTC